MNIDITLAEALERASARLRKQMLHSVELLQKAETIALNYDAEQGYYLAFSGGKDSQALYHMTQLAGVRFQSHMNLTSVDPPEVIRFVKKNYPEVELIKPGKSIFQHAVEKQILPTKRVRWCCKEYKETAGAGKVTLIGIRKAESTRRAKRNEVEINNRKFSGDLDGLDEYRQEQRAKRARRKSKEQGVNITNADKEQTLGCIHGKESLLISPIIYWTEQDVWEFLNDVVKVPHCSLYDEGRHRIGCIGCPMSSAKQKRIENERYPHIKRNWIRAIKAIRNGGYSKENISGGTSARTGCLSETSEDCSGHRRLHQKSRPGTLDAARFYKQSDWGGGEISRIRGAAMPTFRICKQWIRTNDNWG
jgi:phosphoadenosine phosphosulfate reductase